MFIGAISVKMEHLPLLLSILPRMKPPKRSCWSAYWLESMKWNSSNVPPLRNSLELRKNAGPFTYTSGSLKGSFRPSSKVVEVGNQLDHEKDQPWSRIQPEKEGGRMPIIEILRLRAHFVKNERKTRIICIELFSCLRIITKGTWFVKKGANSVTCPITVSHIK